MAYIRFGSFNAFQSLSNAFNTVIAIPWMIFAVIMFILVIIFLVVVPKNPVPETKETPKPNPAVVETMCNLMRN